MKRSLLFKILLFLLPACIAVSSVTCGKQTSESVSNPIESESIAESVKESESVKQSEKESESVKESVALTDADLVDFIVEVETGRDIRVMQLSDIQVLDGSQQRYQARIGTAWVGGGGPAVRYKNQIRQVVQKYDPDLIIMAGDNVYGEFDDSGERLLELIEFMDSLQVPWAPVLGNHDAETYRGVDWQCQQYENSEYCLFKQRDLTGNGNYTVGLSQGGVLKRVFYMMDTNGAGNLSAASRANDHTVSTQGFASDQIDWYTQSATLLKAERPNVKLSFCFHIPIKAFKDASMQYGYSDNINQNPINLNVIGKEGDFGVLGMAYSPWDTDNKVWNSFKKLGVDSIFVGHEHRNSASIVYEGVRLTFGQKSSTYDTVGYYNKTTGEVFNSNASGLEAMIGGTCIPVSEETGEIVNPYILLYDKDDPNFVPEEDTYNLGVPTVDNISDTVGSYRGYNFDRYTLEDIEAQDETLADGFSAIVGSDAYSLKFKVKTAAQNHNKGTLKIFFSTDKNTRGDYSISIKSNTAIICGQSITLNLKANTEYDIEVGFIKINDGSTAYVFFKIDGVLADRWVLTEFSISLGDYIYVTQSGQSDLCEFVK